MRGCVASMGMRGMGKQVGPDRQHTYAWHKHKASSMHRMLSRALRCRWKSGHSYPESQGCCLREVDYLLM